jgi:hypothetical protein
MLRFVLQQFEIRAQHKFVSSNVTLCSATVRNQSTTQVCMSVLPSIDVVTFRSVASPGGQIHTYVTSLKTRMACKCLVTLFDSSQFHICIYINTQIYTYVIHIYVHTKTHT